MVMFGCLVDFFGIYWWSSSSALLEFDDIKGVRLIPFWQIDRIFTGSNDFVDTLVLSFVLSIFSTAGLQFYLSFIEVFLNESLILV
jgi:hypothetical protein